MGTRQGPDLGQSCTLEHDEMPVQDFKGEGSDPYSTKTSLADTWKQGVGRAGADTGRASEGSGSPSEDKHWRLGTTVLAEEAVKGVRSQIHFERRAC